MENFRSKTTDSLIYKALAYAYLLKTINIFFIWL